MAIHSGIEFGAEDSARLRRLLEEVQGRLLEVALIAARVRGESLDANTMPVFKPRESTEEAQTVLIEILDNVPGAGPDGGPGQCCVTIAPGFTRLDCPC
jgi:hypothetical protein